MHIAASNKANGIVVSATDTTGVGYAIQSTGALYMVPGSCPFTIPGILGIYYVSGLTGTISASRQFGGSATITTIKRTNTGTYTVAYTNPGGGSVYPVVIPNEMIDSKPVAQVCVTSYTSSSFIIKSYSTEDNSLVSRDFSSGVILLFGKNGTTANKA